ncbi:family 10 glycosylhydrolase [Actinoallomurus sp. NBC_01490]|uniref:glycoside hydrolase family 10 protein n=1 Tax=Actinoallomurus sp. NBC_01490 TaxID=2903557 RepID=UPI002E3381DD|nr:family 10 glycosylhydrolase [Actinoallomurus sp. NBC_01490]
MSAAAGAALLITAGGAGCGGGDDEPHASAAGAPAAECGQTTAQRAGARQTRAMWIATVNNGDWPSRPGLPVAKQQAEYRHLLDVAKKLHFNTVYVQVRPAADAFYASHYEPWSRFLTGHPGANPGYDPLRFLITEAHQRGLQLHAWFNPYRAATQADPKKLAANSQARLHPDWVHRYGGALWFDPGLPQVRDLAVRVVLDVVQHYDVDGVHLDDYFYPYPIAGKAFPDAATFKKYGAGYKNLGDWRRHNVDTLVQELHTRIHQAKGWVQFGISPFGVWRNKSRDKAGSATAALQSYDDIYADSRTWVRKGWVDYIAPQLYWPVGFKAADYRTLVAWWAKQVAGTHVQLIIGQAAYQVGQPGAWKDPGELSRHVAIDAGYPQVGGEAFFSAHDLAQDRRGFATRLLRDHYSHPALAPVAGPGKPPAAPAGLTAKNGRLTWKGAGAAAYAVYRAPAKSPACIAPDRKFLLKVVDGDVHATSDKTAEPGRTYTYYVTALDGRRHESATTRGVQATAARD